jgi:hypothetical protein
MNQPGAALTGSCRYRPGRIACGLCLYGYAYYPHWWLGKGTVASDSYSPFVQVETVVLASGSVAAGCP